MIHCRRHHRCRRHRRRRALLRRGPARPCLRSSRQAELAAHVQARSDHPQSTRATTRRQRIAGAERPTRSQLYARTYVKNSSMCTQECVRQPPCCTCSTHVGTVSAAWLAWPSQALVAFILSFFSRHHKIYFRFLSFFFYSDVCFGIFCSTQQPVCRQPVQRRVNHRKTLCLSLSTRACVIFGFCACRTGF